MNDEPIEKFNNKKNYYPIIFRSEYDLKIGCLLEHLHPFDMKKWGKVAKFLNQTFIDSIEFIEPIEPITNEELRFVHDDKFIKNLKSKKNIVQTSESVILFLFSHKWINKNIIKSLRYQTSGTIMATSISYKYQLSTINLGGGFHHCTANKSAGFCFFADITLAIRKLWSMCLEDQRSLISILIVDCDAHQGNGYERDILRMNKNEKKLVYIMDMFNPNIYPHDDIAKKAINREIHISYRTNDDNYIRLLEFHLNAIIESDHFQPNLIIYNAGTDCLQGDPLGHLNITAEGIIRRDETIFRFGLKNNCAIIMLLSGGYQRNNAKIIANSIINLIQLNLLKPIKYFD